MTNKTSRREKVSGRVLAINRKEKDQNELFIGSHKFGTMIVKVTLKDNDVDDVKRNDEIELSGKPRIRKRIVAGGSIIRDVLIMNPRVERRSRIISANDLLYR